jgi:RNA 2',3'-cyclic 3'-phosphodiesterase
MKRTFIAVKTELSKDNLQLYSEIKSKLKDSYINWVDADNMHLTLFFLGDTSEVQIHEISEEVKNSLSETKSFSFLLKRLGVFRDLNDPRVVWVGIENDNDLKEIKKRIDKALNKLGYKTEDREFKPHLTLGRIKNIKQKDSLRDLVEKYKDYTLQEIFVGEIVFYESTLTSKGPIYKELQSFKLV